MIFVPDTDQEWFWPTRDAQVWACKQLGHDVTLFTGRRELREATHIILWGSNVDERLVQLCHKLGATIIYMESGWLFDRADGSIQMDLRGIGGRASWVDEPLQCPPGIPLPVNDNERLLVILRYDTGGKKPDGGAEVSPYFRTNLKWIHHLSLAVSIPVCLRPHYLTEERFNKPLRLFAAERGWDWDDTEDDFTTAAEKSKAIAVIDSTAGAQALELGLPVLCYGQQVYRKPWAVHCLDLHIDRTREVCDRLKDGDSGLDCNAIKIVIEKIKARQWHPSDRESWPRRMRKEFAL